MGGLGRVADWVARLPEDGRYVFTRSDAEAASDTSPIAVQHALRRLKERGQVVAPRRGFYVLVPPEYRIAGCPPASWFIDDLMEHLKRSYYVGLLSAAALHGAGHQQPMTFQVFANTVERNIEVGRVRIEFYRRSLIEQVTTQTMRTETGSMVVGTPETTAFDLVRFPAASGYWSNIATVISEIAEKLDGAQIAAGAAKQAVSVVQRLGWLFDFLGEHDLADALAEVLRGKRLTPTQLSSGRAATGAPLDSRWRVLVNDDVEHDL